MLYRYWRQVDYTVSFSCSRVTYPSFEYLVGETWKKDLTSLVAKLQNMQEVSLALTKNVFIHYRKKDNGAAVTRGSVGIWLVLNRSSDVF